MGGPVRREHELDRQLELRSQRLEAFLANVGGRSIFEAAGFRPSAGS